jgi:hypothetical protein
MATTITHPAKNVYHQDFYAWSWRQAELLRARRFSDLDVADLAEEVTDLRETVYRPVRSRVRTIVEHVLKLEHSAADEPKRGWRETIRTQRADLLTAALRPGSKRDCRNSTARLAATPRPRCATTASLRRLTPSPKLPVHSRSDRRRVAAVSRGRAAGAGQLS